MALKIPIVHLVKVHIWAASGDLVTPSLLMHFAALQLQNAP